jgi:hypothetical protein
MVITPGTIGRGRLGAALPTREPAIQGMWDSNMCTTRWWATSLMSCFGRAPWVTCGTLPTSANVINPRGSSRFPRVLRPCHWFVLAVALQHLMERGIAVMVYAVLSGGHRIRVCRSSAWPRRWGSGSRARES